MRKLTAGALTLLLLTACSGDENPEPSASVTPSTTAGSVEDLDDADWLMAEDWQARAEGSSELRVWKYFPTVKWDEDGQRRLHAAVAKGYECLGIAYPESAPSQ